MCRMSRAAQRPCRVCMICLRGHAKTAAQFLSLAHHSLFQILPHFLAFRVRAPLFARPVLL